MKYQKGQILILALTFMLIVLVAVVSLIGYVGIQASAHRQAVAREQGLSVAEAGAELAIWKLNHQAGYSGEINTPYANGVYTVTITTISSTLKSIKVDSFIPDATNPKAHRIIQINATIGTANIGFNFGVQSGQGGLLIDNNAQVTGNVYTNGAVVGNNGAKITGDTTSVTSISNIDIAGNVNSDSIDTSTVSGNSNQHTTILNSTINGNAAADVFQESGGGKCQISGTATYNTNDNCDFLGSSVQRSNNTPPLPDAPAPLDLPIPDSQITTWEQEAVSGGTQGSTTIDATTCPTACLGPKKINGNLVVNGTLTITGTIWVTGTIMVNNGATVQVDQSYGPLTGVLLSDGQIVSSNNTILQGNTANPSSFLLLLSKYSSDSSNAIEIANNAISAIIYAGHGIINILNNADVREVTGNKIHLNQNVILTPSTGTTSATYFSGSSGGWEILDQTWQLLQ